MFGGQTRVPVVFMTQNGGGIGAGPHHSQPVHPFFMNLPLIKVVMPSTPYDVKGLLKAAIRDDNPVIFFNHLSLGSQRGEVPDEAYTLPLGKAEIKRAGRDLTVVAAGLMVHHALKAAAELAESGIEAEVVEVYGDGADAWAASSGSTLAERCEKHGETVFCYTRDAHTLVANLANLGTASDVRYLHRRANLEDVFLKLTGRELRD